MLHILEKFYSKILPVREDFHNEKKINMNNALPFVLAIITSQIILLMLGKFLWNNYLVKNVKLYFDKFEDELQKSVDEPTTPEYDQEKKKA